MVIACIEHAHAKWLVTLLIYGQFLPRLHLLLLEHYLLSIFTSPNPAALETLLAINFYLV